MPASDNDRYLRRARLLIEELQRWFSPLRGRWKTTGWWNAANILIAIIRYVRLSGDDDLLALLPAIQYRRWPRRPRDFINRYYDDEGWWAAAWLEAYAVTGEERYLDTAARLFYDMMGGWDETCGGGIYWRKGSHYKAAIANSLFIHVAAGLYAVSGRDEHYREAVRGWDWLTSSGLVGDDGLVRDGLGHECAVAPELWTYNQGMLAGAAVRMHDAGIAPGGAPENRPITVASRTARATIEKLVCAAGILTEEGEPDLSRDRVQFKGIFMRYVADLWRVTSDEEIGAFVLANADQLWAGARPPGANLVGSSWRGPFDRADAGRQGSALDAMVAAALVASPENRS